MLRNLGMISVSWRQGGTASLADFTLDAISSEERLCAFARDLHLSELAYLATCNRVELLFVRTDETPLADLRAQSYEMLTGALPPVGEAVRRMKAWQGEGAAEHLFLIAAGLDSACVGETEIVGQVRASCELSRRLSLCGPILEILFDEAQKVAAKVRGETKIGVGRVSLAEIAVDLIRERLQRTPGRVALVGVSPMTERAAVSLHAAQMPMLMVNRTTHKAQAFAAQYGAEFLSLESFSAEPPAVEAVLCATGAPHALLSKSQLERLSAKTLSGNAPLIVDMSVPPNIDFAMCTELGVPRVGMDEISQRADLNRSTRLLEAAQAREQVDEALTKMIERFAERYCGQLFGALQQRYRRTAQEGVNRLLKKDLVGLGPQQREAIEAWSAALARRFAHIPCLGLRGLLHAGPEGSIDAFIDGLEPEFADELRTALNRDGRH